MTHELGMGVNDVRDTLARERLFTETALDIAQDLLVRRIRLVQNIFEREIRRAKAVAEMLCEDPAAVCSHVNGAMPTEMKRIHTGVGGVLYRMIRRAPGREERVVRKTIEKRNFFHDLENRALDRRGIRIREGVKVDRDDCNSIRELF